jgi:hypothetical protein
MDVSPTAAKGKLAEQEAMQQLRDAMPSMGGAGTEHAPLVKSAHLANEVDRLKKLALEYPYQGSLSADDLLRFVTVDMKGYEVRQPLAEELLVTPAPPCCVERLCSRGTDINPPRRRRVYQLTLEALMALADNSDLLAAILGLSEPVDIPYVYDQMELILGDAWAQFDQPPGNDAEGEPT